MTRSMDFRSPRRRDWDESFLLTKLRSYPISSRTTTQDRLTIPKIISPATLSGFEHLQELELRYATVAKLERDLIMNPDAFPSLRSLDIEFCGASVAAMFSKMRLPSLKIAKLNPENKEGTTVEFLKVHGSSLEVLVLESLCPLYRWNTPLLDLCCNLIHLHLWGTYRAPIYMNLVSPGTKHTALEILSIQLDADLGTKLQPSSWEEVMADSSSSIFCSEPESCTSEMDWPFPHTPNDSQIGKSREPFSLSFDLPPSAYLDPERSSLFMCDAGDSKPPTFPSSRSVNTNIRYSSTHDDLESIMGPAPEEDDDELVHDAVADSDIAWVDFLQSIPFDQLPGLRIVHLTSVNWQDLDILNSKDAVRMEWSERLGRFRTRLQDLNVELSRVQIVDRTGTPWRERLKPLETRHGRVSVPTPHPPSSYFKQGVIGRAQVRG